MKGGGDVNNNMAKYLKIEKSKGKTITEIISNSTVGRTSFYEIMAGNQIPKLDTAICIAKALNASIEEVFPQLKEVLKDD